MSGSTLSDNELVKLPNHVKINSPMTLAILTVKDKNGKIRGNFSNFKDLSLTGETMGYVVYVLPIDQLNTGKKQLFGLQYNALLDAWLPTMMPFPHLIYNRIPYRQDEASKYVRDKIYRISRREGVKLFNPTFFNKWQLFRWLNQSKTTKAFLPETKRFSSTEGLKAMLDKYNFIYLKPEGGKAGKGIMTVKFERDQTLPYALSIQKNINSKTIRCLTIEKLAKKIAQECGQKPYIAQQGIVLCQYNNCSYDLRLLVQKNSDGKWEISGLGARLAGAASITTHVPRGGKIESPIKLLQSSFGQEQAFLVLKKTEEAALLIAQQIERSSKGLLAEMSMDVGVDHNGDIWFFEANSKPMKFDEPHIRKKSLQRIFQFGHYLLKK